MQLESGRPAASSVRGEVGARVGNRKHDVRAELRIIPNCHCIMCDRISFRRRNKIPFLSLFQYTSSALS
jgi:hypothetical protein